MHRAAAARPGVPAPGRLEGEAGFLAVREVDPHQLTHPQLAGHLPGGAAGEAELAADLPRPAAAGKGRASSEIDQAVALEDVGGGLFVQGSQGAEVGHHEYAVDGEAGDPRRLERVDQHRRCLHPARGVREHSAAADEKVEGRHVDQGFPGRRLLEDVGQGAFRLHPLETDGEGAVLEEGEPQGLARQGVLELQFLELLRYGGRPDHLVLDAVAQVGLIDVERYPAHGVLQPGLVEDVGDAVRHAEVGAHRTVENRLFLIRCGAVGSWAEDAEDIGGGAADVDADDVDAPAAGDGLDDAAHRGRGRDDRRTGPGHQLPVPRGLRHHVLEKEVVDHMPGGSEVSLSSTGRRFSVTVRAVLSASTFSISERASRFPA